MAYGDALTMRYGSMKNQQDHSGLPQLIKSTMKNQADAGAVDQLKAILAEKSAISYGAKIGKPEAAARLSKCSTRFYQWAELMLQSPA